MKTIYKWIACGCFSFGMAAVAQTTSDSGLFIEPGVTYERSSGDINWPSPFQDSSSEVRGFGLSARLGFHLNEAVFIGADGRYSMPEFETSVSSETVDAKAYNYGPVIGVQMPDVGLRVWGAYVVDGELDPDAYTAAGATLDGKFKGGDGFRFGAGFRVFAFSINLEYQNLKYDKAQVQDTSSFAPGSVFDNVELKDESWILGASFPFEL